MKVVANSRTVQGSGASRRLRRDGKVPGIIYGAKKSPINIEIDHNPLLLALKVESFHSSILDLELDGKSEQVLLRDYQMHPYKPVVLHVDFQRIDVNQKLQTKVPLHFKNQEISPAVKLSGGAADRIAHSALDELVVTDSIPLSKESQATGRIRVLSCAGLLAETILRIVKSDSVSSLFVE